MNRTLSFVFAALIAFPAIAENEAQATINDLTVPAGDSDLSEFMWSKRPIVVFADSPDDPRFAEQMDRLSSGADVLQDRDIVVLTDTDPKNPSPLRKKLRPRGFMLVIIGKDGAIGLRRPAPRDVREIIRAIDNFQLRQEELRQGG